MASLSEQLHEVRMQAELCLYSGGSVVEVRASIYAMANLPLPPCSKYCLISAETMVIENSFGSNRKEVGDIATCVTLIYVLYVSETQRIHATLIIMFKDCIAMGYCR